MYKECIEGVCVIMCHRLGSSNRLIRRDVSVQNEGVTKRGGTVVVVVVAVVVVASLGGGLHAIVVVV